MNRLFVIIMVIFCYGVNSQIICIPSQQKANDIIYDDITDKIYITIPDTDTTNGNSIGIVNPYTNVLESTLVVGDKPIEMAISDNGQFIYIAFDGIAKVRRYTITPLAFDMEFTLGANNGPLGHGNYYARDISVMPNQPGTIAVSRKYISNTSPDFAGIAIYDNGVMRSVEYLPSSNSINIQKIKFKDAGTLIGHVGNTIPVNTTIFDVDAIGLTMNANYQNMPNPHPYGITSDFLYRQNKLYFMNGKRLDISTTLIADGQYTTASFDGGGIMYDELNNLVCFGYNGGIYTSHNNGFWNGHLKRFNATTMELLDSYPITTGGEIDKMSTCGDNCYAFITNTALGGSSSANRLVIVRTPELDNETFPEHIFNMYPNPTSSFVHVSNPHEVNIKNITLHSFFGKTVLTDVNPEGFDVSPLAKGIYFCKIITAEGAVSIKKIVKE